MKEHWSTKKTMLQHMISVYNDAKPPDPPTNVQLDIASSHSLTVHFSEPKRDNGSPVTRYKGIDRKLLSNVNFYCLVEWSKCYDFSAIEGSFVLSDLTYKLDPHSHTIEYTIPDLETVSYIKLLILFVTYLFRVKNILCECQLLILRDLVQPVILCHLVLFHVVSVYLCTISHVTVTPGVVTIHRLAQC